MKTILIPVAALGCAVFAGLSALAMPAATKADLHLAGSSDGAGLPGLPGGRGGKSGRDLAREDDADGADDPRLTDYCIAVLRSGGRPAGNDGLRPSDCAAYFMALDSDRPGRSGSDAGRKSDGRDGASIAGGVGGQGGRAGAGSGGGRGGGGGAGVGGGVGGRGGSGGASD